MSKFQVFLIVLYLFFFGGVGGWVLELLFRRFFSGANPERKWLNPGFLFGPCLPLYGFGTVLLFILSELDHTLFGSFFRHVLVLSRDVCRYGAGDDAAGIHRRPCEL